MDFFDRVVSFGMSIQDTLAYPINWATSSVGLSPHSSQAEWEAYVWRRDNPSATQAEYDAKLAELDRKYLGPGITAAGNIADGEWQKFWAKFKWPLYVAGGVLALAGLVWAAPHIAKAVKAVR